MTISIDDNYISLFYAILNKEMLLFTSFTYPKLRTLNELNILEIFLSNLLKFLLKNLGNCT